MTKEKLQQLLTGTLSANEIVGLDDHLASCEVCRARTAEMNGALASRFERSITAFDHLAYSQLAGYADNALSSVERATVSDHIQVCEECRSDIEDLIAVRPESASVSPAGWFESVKAAFFRPVPILASVLVLAVIGTTVWRFSSADTVPSGEGVAATIPDTVPEEVPPPVQPSSTTSEARLTVFLNDGGATVGLTASGELSGYDTVASAYRDDVKRVLSGAAIKVPDLRDLKAASGAFMSDGSSSTSTLRVRMPVRTVVLTNSPTFVWQAMADADSYTIEVFDLNFRKVASSGELKTSRWTTTLPRGRTYLWQVTARKGDEVFKAPRPPAPEARFRIVDSKAAAEIATLRRSKSRLPLAIAYAEAGLIDDAIRELGALSKQNPRSELPKRLIRQLRQAK